MKTNRLSMLLGVVAATALVLSACEKKPPPLATGSVASADGVEIKYDVAGQGSPALVFVHCWSCNRGFWDEQFKHFAKKYRVVRLDLAGHGESGDERKDYTMAAFGADVVAVADKLGLKKIVLIGHSMGGPVAAEAEKRLGDRVIGVVGVDTFHTGWQNPEMEEIDEFVKPFEENFAENADKFVRSIFPPESDKALVERVTGTLAAAEQAVAVSAMRNLLVWILKERQAAFERMDKRLRNINADPAGDQEPPHESVVLVNGASHFVPQEKPAEFNRALNAMIAEFTRGAGKS